MAVTIHDVARGAGCSKSTVSRYFNGSSLIAAETRDRIAEAVRTLRYRPNEIGRSLKMQVTQTIGVLVPSLTNPVFAASLAGVQDRARAAGLSVIVATSDYDRQIELAAVETLLGQRVGGLVLTLCDGIAPEPLSLVEREECPFVLLFNQSERPERPSISVDNVGSARAMVEAMIALGHRDIAFLAGRFSASDRSRLRYCGYVEASKAAGYEPRPPLEVDFTGAGAARAMREVFRAADHPTALLCSTDILAISAIATLRELGLEVPRDVSVAGFDGIAIGEMVSPRLATVIQPSRQMGTMAAEMLVNHVPHQHALQASRLLDFELRLGGTLGPAPARNQQASRPSQGVRAVRQC